MITPVGSCRGIVSISTEAACIVTDTMWIAWAHLVTTVAIVADLQQSQSSITPLSSPTFSSVGQHNYRYNR